MERFSAKKTFKDIRNFLAGRFVGATRDEFLLEEIVKLIFCKFELQDTMTSFIGDVELSNLYRKTFKNVLKKYNDIYSDESCEIALDPVSIKFIDEKLSELDLNSIQRDIIGDAYETFIGDAIKGQSGQFFTPQNAADALVRIINPDVSNSILDLTCGAGGFLVATIKYWAKQGIDFTCGISNLYGIDKDDYLTRLAKIHLACLTHCSANIKCADSLEWDTSLLGRSENAYDVILTNPPFGVNIQAGSLQTLSKFELAHKFKHTKNGYDIASRQINESVAPQVVFMEQCIRLVKPNGYIGIVVPESMISNKKYSYVSDYIMKHCCVKAVIGMPEELFKTSGKGGTHTKTCLLVLQKWLKKTDSPYDIFMAEAKWCGHDSRGRAIPNDDIPTIVDNYNSFIRTQKTKTDNLSFSISSSQIDNCVLAPRAYTINTQNNDAIDEEHFDLITIGSLLEEQVIQISTGDEVGKLAYGTGTIPFVRTSDISNWEIKSDPKHLLSEDVYNLFSIKQDVQEGDILMVKDGTYLVGTCAMISKYDSRIVYQSHFYKIRVMDNKYGLDRYYLLAALSSDYLRNQILSKTFSQDIINSLGDRLKDLLIPIPKARKHIKRISEMVKRSLDASIEARELAKKARKEIFTK